MNQNAYDFNQWLPNGSHVQKFSPIDLIMFTKPRALYEMNV